MREIKFRLWDKFRRTMYNPHQFANLALAHNVPDWAELGTDTVVLLPYTGLKDKKGVGIYEGDILVIYHTDKRHYGARSVWQVTSNLTSWGYEFNWENISGYQCSTHVMREDPVNYKVIGNIYENPGLLGS